MALLAAAFSARNESGPALARPPSRPPGVDFSVLPSPSGVGKARVSKLMNRSGAPPLFTAQIAPASPATASLVASVLLAAAGRAASTFAFEVSTALPLLTLSLSSTDASARWFTTTAARASTPSSLVVDPRVAPSIVLGASAAPTCASTCTVPAAAASKFVSIALSGLLVSPFLTFASSSASASEGLSSEPKEGGRGTIGTREAVHPISRARETNEMCLKKNFTREMFIIKFD